MRLPDLDDKSYRTLLEEAVARIPAIVPTWTDHNPQDTGMLLLELCAALTEAQLYRLNASLAGPLEAYHSLIREQKEEALSRAVTAEDWERAALASPLGLDRAKAAQVGRQVTLTLERVRAPLNEAELATLRRSLEPLRLLTVRLTLTQSPPAGGRES